MASDKPLLAYIHKQITPLDKAYLHISDLAVQRGYGVFEFLKCQYGQPLFWDDYLDRFFNSASLMELQVPHTKEELKGILLELVRHNDLELSGLKLILTGGYSADGYNPAEEANLLITQLPFNLPSQEMLSKGIKVITHEYVREVPTAKTINYSMGIRLIKQIKAQAADDVLYHQQGVVTEFPRCNFFMVTQDDVLVTPDKQVLRGITRKNVMALAGKKYNVEERTVTLDEVHAAKEAFLTSTTKRILPIVQVDDAVIGNGIPGAISLELLQDLIALEKQQVQAAV